MIMKFMFIINIYYVHYNFIIKLNYHYFKDLYLHKHKLRPTLYYY